MTMVNGALKSVSGRPGALVLSFGLAGAAATGCDQGPGRNSVLEDHRGNGNCDATNDLTEVDSSIKIAEHQWARGPELKFTNFDSCIGVVGRQGNELTGVHLVCVGEQDVVFNDAVANQVIELLAGSEETAIFGFAEIWQSNFPEPYHKLTQMVPSPTIMNEDMDPPIRYGVSVKNGRISVETLAPT